MKMKEGEREELSFFLLHSSPFLLSQNEGGKEETNKRGEGGRAHGVLHSLVVVTTVSGLHGPAPESLTALTRYLYCVSAPSPVTS